MGDYLRLLTVSDREIRWPPLQPRNASAGRFRLVGRSSGHRWATTWRSGPEMQVTPERLGDRRCRTSIGPNHARAPEEVAPSSSTSLDAGGPPSASCAG